MNNKIVVLLGIVLISFLLNVGYGSCDGGTGDGSSGSSKSSAPAKIDNPLGNGNTDPNQLIGLLIKGVLGVTGSLALVMFIYGGLVWMTAMGAPDKVKKGRDIILWATIGLVVIFSAYALVFFVLNDIIGGASS